ncbi:MAG: hypothetical protein K2W91_09650 [Novosphingobium sp.]|nr:hypothetical protein [Novosphingobium sp.]
MKANRKKLERADALQDSSVSAWYLAVCLMVVMAGGVWAANSVGWLDLGSRQGETFDKAAVTAAAQKAAAREAQARLAAQQEARNLAEDSARLAPVPASPAASASAAADAGPADQEPATPQNP